MHRRVLKSLQFKSRFHHTEVKKNENFDATSVFFNSVKSSIEGFSHPNYIVEFQPFLSPDEKSRMKRFLIFKYNPMDELDQPKLMSYYVDVKQIGPMYLDALHYIKDNLDSSLTFRRSCREGICGSCSMNCDGLHTLACIRPYDINPAKTSLIMPLGHMFVLKDLVVDLTNCYTQYKSINPYLQRKTPKLPGQKEYLQTEKERDKLNGLYECILCFCCSTSCPSYWWNPDKYLGPAVLLQMYRWIADSRDEAKDERLEYLTLGTKLEGCVYIGMCKVTCPKGLDPLSAIKALFKEVKDMKERRLESQF